MIVNYSLKYYVSCGKIYIIEISINDNRNLSAYGLPCASSGVFMRRTAKITKTAKIASAIMLVIMMMLTICSCGSSDNTSRSDMPELNIGGVIYAPYFYRNADGDYDGIDAELAREACARLGYRPSFEEVSIGTQFSVLESGDIDCVWSCISMDEYNVGVEEGSYMWAGPYLYSQRVVMVKSDSDIQTIADLEGKRVGVQTGSASENIIIQRMSDGKFPGIEQLTVMESVGNIFTALRKDYVDAIAGHEAALNIYADEYPGQYRCLNMSIRKERLGVAFRKDGDAELAYKLDRALKGMSEDGTTQRIIEKYGLNAEQNIIKAAGTTDEKSDGGSEDELAG